MDASEGLPAPSTGGRGRGRATPRSHPTREVLITTVVQLLEVKGPEDLKVEEVLGQSGISVGSLYHHFENFGDLIDQAVIARYAADIDANIEALVAVVVGATDRASLAAGLRGTTVRTVSPDRAAQRSIRSQVMARAMTSERFREALLPHQQRLTDAVADLVRELQERGLFDARLDPVAASIFIQAYSMGLVVNDASGHPADQETLVALVVQVIERSFLTNGEV